MPDICSRLEEAGQIAKQFASLSVKESQYPRFWIKDTPFIIHAITFSHTFVVECYLNMGSLLLRMWSNVEKFHEYYILDILKARTKPDCSWR